MKAEQKELYVYTKSQFEKELKRITPTCISPIIAVRKVVKNAMNQYVKLNCTNNEIPFSHEDFKVVSKSLSDEIINNEL